MTTVSTTYTQHLDQAIDRLRELTLSSSMFKPLGNPESLAVVRRYMERLGRSLDDLQKTWVQCIFPGKKCDTGLLNSGLASMNYPTNVVVLATSMSAQLAQSIRLECRSKRSRVTPVTTRSNSVNEFLRMLNTTRKNRPTVPTVLVPWFIPNLEHWTLIAAIPDEQTSGTSGVVWWGDSLGSSPPPRVLSVIRVGMDMLLTNLESDGKKGWSINRKQNLITDRLGFVLQEDTYSCGYYVISAAWAFADRESSVPCFDSQTGKYKAGNVPETTEKVRQISVCSYVSVLLQCAKQLHVDGVWTTPSERDVVEMLKNILCGDQVPFPSLESAPSHEDTFQIMHSLHRKSSTPQVPWPCKFQDNVNCLEERIKQLNEKGFYTGAKLEIRTPARKRIWKFNRSVTLRCVNYTRTNRCRAAITAWQRKSNQSWFVEYRNVHNHDRMTSHAKSKRDKQLFKDLRLLQSGESLL